MTSLIPWLPELLALRNDVGMLSEEYDPRTHAHLGSTPQAFSLVDLVSAALRLSETTCEADVATTTRPDGGTSRHNPARTPC